MVRQHFGSVSLSARSCLPSGGGRFERLAPPQQTALWLCIGGDSRANPDVSPEADTRVKFLNVETRSS